MNEDKSLQISEHFENDISLIRENTTNIIGELSLKLLNSLLAQSPAHVADTIGKCKDALKSELTKKNVTLVFCNGKEALFGIVLADGVIQLLVNGVYAFKKLLSNELYVKLVELFIKEKSEDISAVRDGIQNGYMQEPKNRGVLIISELIKLNYDKTVNIGKSIQQYFMVDEEPLFSEIETTVRKGVS